MLFDDGTGPIRDLAWLDPTGSLKAEWDKFIEGEKEHNGGYRKLPPRGLGPISVKFTPEGPIEYCSISAFRLLTYRILSGQWQPPDRVGCSPDAHDYNSPEGVRWAIEIAYGFLGMKTPYTDTFHVWDVPRPWEHKEQKMTYQVDYLNPADLIPYEKNAKLHPQEQLEKLAKEMKDVGFTQPIVIDHASVIVVGHGRREAALLAGLEQVPVHRLPADMPPERVRAMRLFDNRIAETENDKKLLKAEIDALVSMDGFDFSWTGYGKDEIISLLPEEHPFVQNEEERKAREDERADEVPEVDGNPRGVERGQVWKLGRHRLMCGDSTDQETVNVLLAGEKPHMLFSSPPYSDLREYGGGLDLSIGKLARIFDWPCSTFYVNLGLKIKNRVLDRYWDEWVSQAEKRNLPMVAWLVWSKGNASAPAHQQAMFGLSHEWIFVFGEYRQQSRIKENKGTATWGQSTTREVDGSLTEKTEGERRSHRQLDSVIELGPQKNFGADYVGHPAQFPTALPEMFIKSHTQEGDSVCEPFGGSGTTLIACEKTGRTCFMMELDEHYCSVIIQRFEDFTGQKAELTSP